MTFTEAAIEVLRRAGKPLHFKEIATEAVNAGLLSHVGQTPEATMGARLLSMAKHEQDRRISAIDAGVFALAEWGLNHAQVAIETTQVEEVRADDDASLRPKERHPQLQDEYSVGTRRDERRRGRGDDDESRKKKRYAPPADVAYQWLRERGSPATVAEMAEALRASDKIAEALERDLRSFERALQEENRRRSDGHRPPLFQFDAEGRVIALEAPKEQPRERPPRPEKTARREEVRPVALDEQRRNVVRSIRRRIGGLDLGALERVVCSFLEATGYRELNMARRTRDATLYLARRKWGSGELRYAIRIMKPGRELGRQEVQDLRRDLAHFSAQLGILVGTGECSRDAKSESNTPGSSPAMLYGGEALAEALAENGLGATRRMVEWLEYDDDFFFSVSGEASTTSDVEEEEESAPAEDEGGEDRSRRGRDRDRRRERRPREAQGSEAPVEAAPAAEAEASVEAPVEAAQPELPFAKEPPAEDTFQEVTPPSNETPAAAQAEQPAEPSLS